MIDRILSSLVALSLALLVWLYARSRDQEILDNVTLPVQVSLAQDDADHYSLEVNGPSQAVVSFSGPSDRIHELRGEIQRNELHIEVGPDRAGGAPQRGRYSDTVHIDAVAGAGPARRDADRRRGPQPHPRHRPPHWSRGRCRCAFDALQEEPAGPGDDRPARSSCVTAPQEVLDHIRSIPTLPSDAADAAGQRPAHRRRRRPRRPRPGAGRPARPGRPGQGDGQGAAAAAQGVRPAATCRSISSARPTSPCGRSSSTTAPAASRSRHRADPGRAAEGVRVHRSDARPL